MLTYMRHYVEFYSPGTFVSETSRRSIDKWDIAAAVELANGVTERYNAKPFGFRFLTFLEADPVDDGRGGQLKVEAKEIKRSPLHYLGGRVIRYDDIPDTKENQILRSNMRLNDMPLVVENANSWKFTGNFQQDELIVDADGKVIRRGTDADLLRYREEKLAAFKRERGL